MPSLSTILSVYGLLVSWNPLWVLGAGYMDQNTYTTQGAAQKVRRERNLDHWDSDTLAYYLDEYQGHDVAVMFYAQWDSNSHALAPYWDRIATLLDAGNTESRLIMSLFDCELNVAHSQLCQAVGITHYPTVMFVGSGPYHDTDPITKTLFGAAKSAGIMGEAPVVNTVKFQGNWQYADSILDWIRTMQALSNWHLWSTQGFGKRLRNFFLPQKTSKSPLPIGVPARSKSVASTKSVGNDDAMQASADGMESFAMQQLESRVEQLGELNTQYEKMIVRSSNMMDNLLAPVSTADAKTDMFAKLAEQNAWTNPNNEAVPDILKNCVAELSLDYCQRVSQRVANAMVDELTEQGKSVDELLSMPNLEDEILNRVKVQEPYCAVLETCIISDFAEPECKPSTCPFENPVACQYLTSCLDPMLQQEYAEVLGHAQTSEMGEGSAGATTESQEETPRKKWGM